MALYLGLFMNYDADKNKKIGATTFEKSDPELADWSFGTITSSDQSTSRFLAMPSPAELATADGMLHLTPYHVTSGFNWMSPIFEAALHKSTVGGGFDMVLINAVTSGTDAGFDITFKKELHGVHISSLTRSISGDGSVSESMTFLFTSCKHTYYDKTATGYEMSCVFDFNLKTHTADSATEVPPESAHEGTAL